MFEKFGELNSAEELNKAAAGLKEERDVASLIVLAEENGLDKEDAEDYAAGEMEELATPCTAAHGRLKVESEDLKIAGVLMDWVDEIRQECLENEKVCAGVMNHSLAGYMAILLEKGFEEKAVVDNRIVQQAANYLRKQQAVRKRALSDIWMDWKDYINMLEKRKTDMTNGMLIRPKDLTVAHNELVLQEDMLKKGTEIEEKKKTFKKAEKLMQEGTLKKYEYQDDKYCIVAPTGIKDIYVEGMALKHCIHTCDIYFQRIDIRETYLLFLRKVEAPDTPWYTLEVEPGGNIRQKKSVLNEAYADLEDAMPFLKEWQQWVKKNLSKEDAALAEKSDKARKKNYGQLRREKKLIWHGRLQGTMLVDALESDFMEV